MGEGRSWQRGVRGSNKSPSSKTVSGDNEDAQPVEEPPADEKVSLFGPWISGNRRAADLELAELHGSAPAVVGPSTGHLQTA